MASLFRDYDHINDDFAYVLMEPFDSIVLNIGYDLTIDGTHYLIKYVNWYMDIGDDSQVYRVVLDKEDFIRDSYNVRNYLELCLQPNY